jgi:hypothetical protein
MRSPNLYQLEQGNIKPPLADLPPWMLILRQMHHGASVSRCRCC